MNKLRNDDFILQYLAPLKIKVKIPYNGYEESQLVAIKRYDDGRKTVMMKNNDGLLFECNGEENSIKFIEDIIDD